MRMRKERIINKYGVQFKLFHPWKYTINPQPDVLIDVQVRAIDEADATCKAITRLEELLNIKAKQLKVEDTYAETNES